MSSFAKYRCTFCGAHSDDVETLFAGPNHQAICDRCVSWCAARLNGEPAHDDIPGRLAKWRREVPVYVLPEGMHFTPFFTLSGNGGAP